MERTRQESGVKNKAAGGFLPPWLKTEHLEHFVPLTQVHVILTGRAQSTTHHLTSEERAGLKCTLDEMTSKLLRTVLCLIYCSRRLILGKVAAAFCRG